jgi:hypothetical protein
LPAAFLRRPGGGGGGGQADAGSCLEQYACTKRACQATAWREIAELAEPLDGELPDAVTTDQARHAHRRCVSPPGST